MLLLFPFQIFSLSRLKSLTVQKRKCFYMIACYPGAQARSSDDLQQKDIYLNSSDLEISSILYSHVSTV